MAFQHFSKRVLKNSEIVSSALDKRSLEITHTVRGATRPLMRGGGELSWVWVDHRVKRSERGEGCIRSCLELALKIVVLDSTHFPILSMYMN